MYRLLLLDDEEIVTKGIQKVFDLKKSGFEVVGAFSNPLKALEQAPVLCPDLIITDVKMPQMDGLTFASEVKKVLPNAEVVILSGYDDFSFAQTAVKLGVSDYILKPIKKDDFLSMLQRMNAKISEKLSMESQYKMLQELVQNSYLELRNRYYLELAENDHFDEGLYEALKKHDHTDIHSRDFMLIKVDTYEMDKPGDYAYELGKLCQEMESVLGDFGEVLHFGSDESTYFMICDIWHEQYDDIVGIVKDIVAKKEFENIKMVVGFSHIYKGMKKLFTARNDCVRQIYMTQANIDESSETGTVYKTDINVSMPYSDIERLFQAISVNDQDNINTMLDTIYSTPENDVHILYRDYFSSITFLILLRIYQLQSKYQAKQSIVEQGFLDLKLIGSEYPQMDQQKKMVLEASNKIAEVISYQKNAAPSKMIQAALEYINHHYGENISLQDVAEKINISKNYLCDIFKKEIGVTFINYVTNLRIEKAKEFLANTDMKMYEVSNAVGYNDYAYFSQIFKKHTGTTLSAYRKNN